MITFDFLPFHGIMKEISPHIPRYYSEMTEGDSYGIPDLDWDCYIEASLNNQCHALTAREKGEFVGFAVYVIGANPRYRQMIQADCHALFVEKPYRGKISMEFIKRADVMLRQMGVNEIQYTMSDARIGKLLARLGYTSNYTIWSSHGQ